MYNSPNVATTPQTHRLAHKPTVSATGKGIAFSHKKHPSTDMQLMKLKTCSVKQIRLQKGTSYSFLYIKAQAEQTHGRRMKGSHCLRGGETAAG